MNTIDRYAASVKKRLLLGVIASTIFLQVFFSFCTVVLNTTLLPLAFSTNAVPSRFFFFSFQQVAAIAAINLLLLFSLYQQATLHCNATQGQALIPMILKLVVHFTVLIAVSAGIGTIVSSLFFSRCNLDTKVFLSILATMMELHSISRSPVQIEHVPVLVKPMYYMRDSLLTRSYCHLWSAGRKSVQVALYVSFVVVMVDSLRRLESVRQVYASSLMIASFARLVSLIGCYDDTLSVLGDSLNMLNTLHLFGNSFLVSAITSFVLDVSLGLLQSAIRVMITHPTDFSKLNRITNTAVTTETLLIDCLAIGIIPSKRHIHAKKIVHAEPNGAGIMRRSAQNGSPIETLGLDILSEQDQLQHQYFDHITALIRHTSHTPYTFNTLAVVNPLGMSANRSSNTGTRTDIGVGGCVGGTKESTWKRILRLQQEFCRMCLARSYKLIYTPCNAMNILTYRMRMSKTMSSMPCLSYLGEGGTLSSLELLCRAAAFQDLNRIVRAGAYNSRKQCLLHKHWSQVVFICTAMIDAVSIQIEIVDEHVKMLSSDHRGEDQEVPRDKDFKVGQGQGQRSPPVTAVPRNRKPLHHAPSNAQQDLYLPRGMGGRGVGRILSSNRPATQREPWESSVYEHKQGVQSPSWTIGDMLQWFARWRRQTYLFFAPTVGAVGDTIHTNSKPSRQGGIDQAKRYDAVLQGSLSPINTQATLHAIDSVSLFLYSALCEDPTGLTHAAVPSVVQSLLRLELVIRALASSIHDSFVTAFNDAKGKSHLIRYKLRANSDLPESVQTLLNSTKEALSKLIRGYKDVLSASCQIDEYGDSRLIESLKEKLSGICAY